MANLLSSTIGSHFYGSYNQSNILLKTAGNTSDGGILLQNSAGAFKFQIYGNGTDYGFLDGVWADWDIRKTINGRLYLNGTSSYYLQTDGHSYLSTLHVGDASSGVSLHVGNGSTHGVYTLDNARKYLVVSADYYPHMALVASGANNTNHGAVFSFVGSEGGSFRQWNIGIPNNNPFIFSIGYNRTGDANPHYGVGDGWSSEDYNHARLSIDRDGNTKIRGMLYVNGTSGGISTGSAVIHAGNIGSQSVSVARQLLSPNDATVVAADSAMPSAGHSFIHTLALGPGGNDGHILGMTWAGTTSVYGAQIFLDTDPNDIMAIRSRSNAGVWTSWKTIIHSGTIGSQSVNYATSAGNSVSTDQTNFSALFIEDAAVATKEFVTSQGYLTSLPSHNHDDRYYTESESDNRYVPYGSITGSFGLNDNKLYLRTNGDNNHYLWNAADDWEELVYYTGTGFRLKGSTGVVPAYFTDSEIKFNTRLAVGNFPQSLTNTGEAWIGRANDRNTGTLTVQLGGNSASSRSFEVVDYAWSTVMFSVNSDNTVSVNNYLQAGNSLRAPIFYDSNDTGYYLDPNGTSNLLQLTTATRARWNMPRVWYDRSSRTSDQGYWTGTNGWGAEDGTWANAWKGGFSGWDIWGTGTDHPQGSGYIHAQGIVSGQHYATSSVGYGWMMVGAANATDNRYWLRGKWDTTTSSWVEMITTGNIGSQSVSYATNSGNSATTSQRSFDYIYGTSYLESAGAVYGTIFYDNNDRSYYVDPNSTSKLVQVNLGTTNTRLTSSSYTGYVEFRGSASNYLGVGSIDNNGWGYIESVNNSNGLYLYTPAGGRFAFDNGDVTPYNDAENSLGNGSYRWSQVYTSGWLRQYGAQGMYNQDYGTHFYSSGGATWNITGSGGVVELTFRSNHQSTIRGYVYADTANTIGFLNNGGSWSLRTDSSRNTVLYGNLTVGQDVGYSSIYMYDSDEGTREIHCNSNRIGFLNQSSSWGSWCYDDGSWATGVAMYSPIYYDSDDTNYYGNFAGFSRMSEIGVTNNYVYNYDSVESSRSTAEFGNVGKYVATRNGVGDYPSFSYEHVYGTHSWGQIARFHIRQSGADRPSIQFSSGSSNTRWNIGYCTGSDDNFRISQNMGYRPDNSGVSDGWGTPRLIMGTNGIVDVPQGYISNGNPWGTSNSAFFPNGITTAGGTNWIYGFTYIGNAPGNGNGHEFNANGTQYSTASITTPTFIVNSHSDNTRGYRIHNTSGTAVSAMFVNSSNQLVIAAGAVDQVNLNKKVYVNGVALGVNVAPSATAGRIDASNDIVAYSSSDERLKYNISPIENALDKVKSLTGVEFDWKPEYKHAHGYEGHDTGIIAQQVEAVMPSAVRTNDTGFLAVRYEKLIGLLIEGMKEQQAQIDELKAKLDGLTK